MMFDYYYIHAEVDECKTSNACVENACINHVGYFNCSCPEGYEGDGRRDGIGCIPKPSNSRTLIITLCKYISASLTHIITHYYTYVYDFSCA